MKLSQFYVPSPPLTASPVAYSDYPRPVEADFATVDGPPESWAPIQMVRGVWYANAVRFETHEEARVSALDKWTCWTQSERFAVAASSDEPNR